MAWQEGLWMVSFFTFCGKQRWYPQNFTFFTRSLKLLLWFPFVSSPKEAQCGNKSWLNTWPFYSRIGGNRHKQDINGKSRRRGALLKLLEKLYFKSKLVLVKGLKVCRALCSWKCPFKKLPVRQSLCLSSNTGWLLYFTAVSSEVSESLMVKPDRWN